MNFRKERTFRFVSLMILVMLTSSGAIQRDSITFDLANDLKKVIQYVFLRGSPDYELARPVHNGGCRHIFPLLIVKPLNTQEVSHAVKIAKAYGAELSVRSGGHSYQCEFFLLSYCSFLKCVCLIGTGTKQDSVHLDLRRLNHIEFKAPYQVVRLGPGAIFKNVLKKVPQKKFTVIHGNALNVGVGGYLLGGGVNPLGTTHRHGYGADSVLEYTIVLADGRIAVVNDDNTTIIQNEYGDSVHQVHPHTHDTNLRYALRRAGASYGIVTEFVYKVFQHPETLSVVALAFLKDQHDLQNLVHAGQEGRYAISITQPMFYRRPKPAHLTAWGFIKVPQIVKFKAGQKVLPTAVSIVDLKSNNGKTDPGSALAFLQKYGIEVAEAGETFMESVGFDRVNLSVDDNESVYMTHDELKAEGYHTMTSANANGFQSFNAIADTFLYHPKFGMFSREKEPSDNFVCDFCVWILYIGHPGKFASVMLDTQIGPLYVGLDCTFNSHDAHKATYCPKEVEKVQRTMMKNAIKLGEVPHQYSNTPGCDNTFFSFGQRYWGNSYPRLLKIKQYWDPDNSFNYCHSVGSKEEFCCVT